MASLEQQIADLQNQASLLLDLPQQMQTAALEHIEDIANSYQAHINSLEAVFFVSQNGDDSASGLDADSPLKTLSKAMNLTPMGGAAEVRLMSDIHVSEDVNVEGKTLDIISNNNVKHKITFEHLIVQSGVNEFSRPRSFHVDRMGSVSVRGLTLVLPHSNDIYSNLIYDHASSIFKPSSNRVERGIITSVNLTAVDIERPAGSKVFLSARSNGLLVLGSNGVIETQAPMAGQWVHDVPAGSSPSVIIMLQTNIPSL